MQAVRSSSPPVPPRGCPRRSGFTIMEAALATVIIATGVLAILAAQQAYHQKNDWANRAGLAMLLANELRELSMFMPQHDPITGNLFLGPEPNEMQSTLGADGIARMVLEPGQTLNWDDLDDFAGAVDPNTGRGQGTIFDPPINALGQAIENMPNWEQHIQIANVLPDNISVAHAFTQPLGTTEMVRVTVNVNYTDPRSGEKSTVTTLTWVVGDKR